MITASSIAVRRNGTTILDSISLTTEPGTITMIIGPNGAGKSTFLGVLAGDVRPSSGMVEVGGRDIRQYHPRELARLRAVVPQHTATNVPLPVIDVVQGMAQSRSWWWNNGDHGAMDMLEQVELRHKACDMFSTLSGGERQLVMIARALYQLRQGKSPKTVLLLDEPTSALDLRHQRIVYRLMRDAADLHSMSVICVSHDVLASAERADRLLVLDRGACAFAGRPVDLVGTDLLTDRFGVPIEVQRYNELQVRLALVG